MSNGSPIAVAQSLTAHAQRVPRPDCNALRRATRRASCERSIPRPRAAGSSPRIESRRQPEPVPRSRIRRASSSPMHGIADKTASIRASLSGLGSRTAGVTAKSSFQKDRCPAIWLNGTRRARSAMARSISPGFAPDRFPHWMMRRNSLTGSGMPAARSLRTPAAKQTSGGEFNRPPTPGGPPARRL